jgi:hypothetical protein
MSKQISLDLLNESLGRVGKRTLPKDELREFVMETLQHETAKLTERQELFDNGEIKENEINNFPFHTDGYHYGIYLHLTEDAIADMRGEDGETIQVRQFPKKKNGEIVYDEEGNEVMSERCLMRLKTRKGYMSCFLGLSKAEFLDTDNHYVLVGGLTKKWLVANSDSSNSDNYHAEKKEDVNYTDRPSLTFNLWQIAQIKKKGKGISIILPELNWDE